MTTLTLAHFRSTLARWRVKNSANSVVAVVVGVAVDLIFVVVMTSIVVAVVAAFAVVVVVVVDTQW